MFSFFLTHSFALKPIVLVPGIYGSSLHTTYNTSKHWYCPKTADNKLFWADFSYVVPPRYNCLLEWLSVKYDSANDKMVSGDGFDVNIVDFGGEEGVSYVDEKGVFGIKFIDSLKKMLDYLKDRGYTVRKDLFGAPYDWRLGAAGGDDFYKNLKTLVEEAYKNTNEKVTLLGYSLGGMMTSQFLGKKMTKEWVSKYIEKIIFLAPAFSGAGDATEVAWAQVFPFLKILHFKALTKAIEHVPGLHVLLPNHKVYGDKVLVKGPDRNYTAAQIPDLFINQGKLTDDAIPLFRLSEKISKEEPARPPVPIYLYYNSGLDTKLVLNIQKGYDESYTMENDKGDGTVPSYGVEWACKNWGESITCYDFNTNDKDFDHGGFGDNSAIFDKVFDKINDIEWTKDVRPKIIRAPPIKLEEYNHSGKIPQGAWHYVGNAEEKIEYLD